MERDEKFSTQSAYSKLKEMKEAEAVGSRGECSDRGKVRAFWRSMYHDFLPVATNLLRRGCGVMPQCCVCGFHVQNSVHVFLECWWVREFWKGFNFQPSFLPYKFGEEADWMALCVGRFQPDTL